MATSRAHSPLLAYVLHRYDWSESSVIVELFTRERGRVVVMAKGAKRPTSNFRPVLSRLLCSMSSALMRRGRVCRGSMISSM